MISVFRFRLHLLTALLACLCLSSSLQALEVPALTGRINDYGSMLSDWNITQLEAVLADLEASDSTQLAVLTIPSLEGDSLEAFSLRVVEKWKLGRENMDNGALLLISRDDRKIRIEVGYGLEGRLTDMISGQIIRNIITPQFRKGNFDQGVSEGILAMSEAVKGEFTTSTASRAAANGEDIGDILTFMIFFLVIFGSIFRRNKILAGLLGGGALPVVGFLFFSITGLMLLALVPLGVIGGIIASVLASSTGSGRYYGSSRGGFSSSSGSFGGFSGGGGGFGGGGGGFGGGGASGGW